MKFNQNLFLLVILVAGSPLWAATHPILPESDDEEVVSGSESPWPSSSTLYEVDNIPEGDNFGLELEEQDMEDAQEDVQETVEPEALLNQQ